MPNPPEAEIFKTLVYFDIFSYPLTVLEIWRNLPVDARYGEVYDALHDSVWLKERVEFNKGTWSLRSPPSGERARRYRAAKHKMDIARRFARFARAVSWVQAIYACNSLGFLHARPESDIDLFVIARRGRIWSARFFLVLIAKIFFRRPTGAHTKDAICLSFFATEGADMRRAALPEGDVYFEHWLKNLVPLTPHPSPLPKGEGVIEKSPLPAGEGVSRQLPSPRGRGEGEGRAGVTEKVLKRVQLWLMPAHLRAMANNGTSVMLTDEFLKFHDHDKREYFRGEFERRVAQIAG